MNLSKRLALPLSIAIHLVALYVLLQIVKQPYPSQINQERTLIVRLMSHVLSPSPDPIEQAVPAPAKIKPTQSMVPVANVVSKKIVPQSASHDDLKTPDTTAPTAASTPDSQAKPLSTDPAALVKAYSYENSKSDLQKAIEAHGGTMEVVKKSQYEQFHDAAEFAGIPDCLGPNALKHDPPKIGPIALGGLLAAPFLAHAALTGKCK